MIPERTLYDKWYPAKQHVRSHKFIFYLFLRLVLSLMNRIRTKKMKKVVFIIFSAITFYCNSQEKITLTTGDTLLGKVSEIDEGHSRINKSDGTSLIILSDMIKSINGISSTSQNDSLKNYPTENWKINFQIAPNYAYRIAKKINDNPDKGTSYAVNEEYNIYRWHFSINGTKKIARRIDLNFGIIIDNQGYKTNLVGQSVINMEMLYRYKNLFILMTTGILG